MFVLSLNQAGMETQLGLFETLEEGRAFVHKIPGYQCEEEDGFLYESILLEAIPDYVEIEARGQLVPLTKFMFTEEGDIDIFWKELPNLSLAGSGIVDGATLVDAYAIENDDVKTYIAQREKAYETAKAYLEGKGFEVSRAFFGSEDGEAILYRKDLQDDWHFLTHLDPTFCEMGEGEDFLKEVEEELL